MSAVRGNRPEEYAPDGIQGASSRPFISKRQKQDAGNHPRTRLKHAFDLFFQENHGPDFTALATAYKTEVLGGGGFDAYAV